MDKALISRCLLGELCRWDGKRLPAGNFKLLSEFQLLGICPEMDGGLPCPRECAEIIDGDGSMVLDGLAHVKSKLGDDLTDKFIKGAYTALEIAQAQNIKKAILKDKSPSCGVNKIYNSGQLRDGIGVTAALLKRHNFEVMTIE